MGGRFIFLTALAIVACAAVAQARTMSFMDNQGHSVGYFVLTGEKLVAYFPGLRGTRYEMVLSGGTCSAPALGAGHIVVSREDWVLGNGLKGTMAAPMPRLGHLLLLDLRVPRHSTVIACADI